MQCDIFCNNSHLVVVRQYKCLKKKIQVHQLYQVITFIVHFTIFT